jgi:peptide/nickel transport system substrate-binding protein
VLKTDPSGSRVVAERNPYYWKVDPAGNQLPYLDGIAYTVVQNPEILNFKTMAGDADCQDRRVDAANFPLFMENRTKGHFRVLRDGNPTPIVIYLNQCSRDDEWRPILQNRQFRIALSVAVNRKELIDLIYSGMAKPTRGVDSPFDPYYLPEYDEKYLEYNPQLANQILDGLGFSRDGSGMRRMPNGGPFRQILNVYPAETGVGLELWQLVADYWREVGLDFIVKTDAPSLSVMQVRNGNSDFWAYSSTGMLWIVDPQWYVPWYDTSYFAPLFGRYHATNGKGGVKPPEEYQRLLDWYLELRSVVGDEDRRRAPALKIMRQWAEECYTIGICSSDLLMIVSDRFKNVPDHIIHDYRVMTPGYIGIEQFYIDEG